MANKSNVQFKDWYQSNWGTGLGLEPTAFNVTLYTLLSTAFDSQSLLKTTSTNTAGAEHIIRLPGVKPVIRMVPTKDAIQLYVGTDYVNGVLQNQSTILPSSVNGTGVGTWMTQRAGMYAAPTGVMLVSSTENSTHNYWKAANAGFAAVMKQDGSGIDENRLLIWNGAWGYPGGGYGPYRMGELVHAMLYDWPSNTIIKRTTTTFPAMFLANFSQGLDAAEGKIYGAKAYCPFAPYTEVPFFRVMASDVATPGIVTQAERPYLSLDPGTTAAHMAFLDAYPATIPMGGSGRFSVHWQQ